MDKLVKEVDLLWETKSVIGNKGPKGIARSEKGTVALYF